MPDPTPKDDSFDVLVADTSRPADLKEAVSQDRHKAAPSSRAALTITFKSWATPVVGIGMLLVGLLGGYYGRPFLVSGSPAGASGQATAAQAEGGSSTGNAGVSPGAQNGAALMEAVQAQVRHFRGSPDAPITLVEFSDFL